MRGAKQTVKALLLLSGCNAWNWSGVLKAKTQIDNRNPDDSEFFSKIWESLEVFDNKNWRRGLDFVSRLSDGKREIEADIYQLYINNLKSTALQ